MGLTLKDIYKHFFLDKSAPRDSTAQEEKIRYKCVGGGGSRSTMDSILDFHPVAPGSILSDSGFFSEKFDVSEIHRLPTLLKQWTVKRVN